MKFVVLLSLCIMLPLQAGNGESKAIVPADTSRSSELPSDSQAGELTEHARRNSATPAASGQPPVTVHNTNIIYTNAGAASDTQTNVAATASASATARLQNHLASFFQNYWNPSEWHESTASFFKTYKKRILLGSVATAYISIATSLWRGNQFVNRTDTWAAWQPLRTLEELHEHTQLELQKKLHEDILKHYLLKGKNRINAYLFFLKAIEYEQNYLNRHITLCRWVRRSKLMRFFPMNDTKIARAETLYKRLTFIKHIFISWAAQQDALSKRIITH